MKRIYILLATVWAFRKLGWGKAWAIARILQNLGK